jgi:hypothetical protein
MSSPLPTSLPYGIRDIRLTPYTDAGATTLGTPVDLPYAQTMKFSEAESFDTLRGDDSTVTVRGQGPTGTWELGAGGLSLAAVAVMTGAVLTTTGTTPARVSTLKKNISHVRPWFKAEGQSISDSGGDLHAVLYRCRMTDSLDGELTDSTFFITSAKGTMLGSNMAASVGALYDFVQNETAVAIP